MTIRDSSVARAQAGVVTDPIPDPQVPERSRGRRQFSAKYKARKDVKRCGHLRPERARLGG
jgi:hypothetical protein